MSIKTIFKKHTTPSGKSAITGKKWIGYCLFLMLVFGFISCTNNTVEEPQIELDFEYDPFTITSLSQASITTGAIENSIAALSYWEKKGLEKVGDHMSFSELEKHSKNYRARIASEYEIIDDYRKELLEEILQTLVAVIDEAGVARPNWKVYVVSSKRFPNECNAFTDGVNITFTEGMITLCEENVHRLAGVMAHEIFHSLNHDLHHQYYRADFFEEKIGERFAPLVTKYYDKLIATPLGQSREMLADIQGIALVDAAGYDAYEAIKVDYHLAEKSESDRGFAAILSTHPPSDARLSALSTVLEVARIRAEEGENSLLGTR